MRKFLQQNWNVITSAPLAFICFAIIIIPIVYFLTGTIYKEHIETLKDSLAKHDRNYTDQINILNARLASKDDLIDEYRQRLHLVDTKKTASSLLTNEELRTKTSNLISQMREFLNRIDQQSRDRSASYWQQMQQAKTEEERHKAWNEQTSRLIREPSLNIEYGEKFKSDAIILRDEMLSRLPKDQKSIMAYSMYEYPINSIVLQMVIDDLDKLSKSLPK
jgi:hypothetical protein